MVCYNPWDCEALGQDLANEGQKPIVTRFDQDDNTPLRLARSL